MSRSRPRRTNCIKREIAAKIDQDIGFLSWELRPTELEEVGLQDAIRSFVREWSNQYGIASAFHTDPSSAEAPHRKLSTSSETNVYRIVQEALNNTLKHAEAVTVYVILTFRGNEVVLVIEDDGCGFDLIDEKPAEERFGGHGLIGMKERASMLGGSLEIESRPDTGTTILVRIPVVGINEV